LYTNAKQKNGRLGEKEVREIIKQVTIAVEYMHKNDIIHRDLKPENILLHEVGIMRFRELSRYAISDGQFIHLFSGTPAAEPHCMLPLKCSRSSSMTAKSISGISEF
jgi:serine/threonine protein kinase